jgi:hypothetical protein
MDVKVQEGGAKRSIARDVKGETPSPRTYTRAPSTRLMSTPTRWPHTGSALTIAMLSLSSLPWRFPKRASRRASMSACFPGGPAVEWQRWRRRMR